MTLRYLYAKVVQRLRGKAIIRSAIHPTAVVYPGCHVVSSQIGKYSYCSYDCKFENTEIGSFCSISDKVYIGGAEHPLNWTSTSPVFQHVKHSGPTKRFSRFELPPIKRTIIGSDVWIGHAATIKQGVNVGVGAVIGSNALVTKDVPPYAVVGGVPAKIIKYRFDEDIITALLNSEWWMMSDEELSKYAYLIKDPKAFLNSLSKHESSGQS